MIEEAEDYQSSIPNIRMIREIAVPRWAVDEPEAEEEYVMPNIPNLGEEIEPSVDGIVRSRWDPMYESFYNEPLSVESPVPDLHHFESLYNELGLLTERREMADGLLKLRERFVFDEDGKLIRRALEDHTDENLEKEERQYDSEGRIIKATIIYSDGSQRVTAHVWNNNTDDARTSGPEGLESHVNTTYDNNGHLVEYIEFDLDNGKASGLFWEYDENGNMTTVGKIELDETRWISETYEYDAGGRELAWAEFDREGNTLQERLSKYENGDCIEFNILDKDGQTTVTQEFNKEHHLLRSSSVGPEIESEAIRMYDKQGLITLFAFRTLRVELNVGITARKLKGGVVRLPSVISKSDYRAYGSSSTTWWQYEFFPS